MTNLPFNGPLYIQNQTQAILDRLAESSWTLYLEVGGHFLVDHHASRVLPGYIPDSKAQIFQKLAETVDLSIIFCINARDVVRDRQFGQKYISFEKHLFQELESISPLLSRRTEGSTPGVGVGGDHNKSNISICFTMLDHDFIPPHIRELEEKLQSQWYATYHKYQIAGYPTNTDLILSPDGYGKDDHIPFVNSPFVKGVGGICLISACWSNSGKFNTCLSQLYLDHTTWTNSSYAKFETFPIRNLSLHHPINLAYEAATADIGDYNMIDPYYTNGESINYNRDVEAFEILKKFWDTLHLKLPSSPTAMGINTAGLCLDRSQESEKIISDACREEIQSRIALYNKLLLSGHGEEEAITRCEELLRYFK
jgi:uncharacterized protein (UPF0371 family)